MNNTSPCFGFVGAGIVAKIAAALFAVGSGVVTKLSEILGFFATYSNALAGISFCIGGIVGLRTLYLSFKKKHKK